MSIDTKSRELLSVQFCCRIVANFANVPSAESPGLARHHCGRDLASWKNVSGAKLHLGAWCREVRDRNEGVGRVETDSNNVHCRFRAHFTGIAWYGIAPARRG